MTLHGQIAELRRLNYEFVDLIARRRREMQLHAERLAGYIAERDAYLVEHPGETLPAVLRYQIEAASLGSDAARREVAELEVALAEQRAALAAAVGDPVEVVAIFAFSFVDQDGTERLCRRNEVHRLPPSAAALAIDASVALRADSLAGLRAREAVAAGEMGRMDADPVRLGDPVGFGIAGE